MIRFFNIKTIVLLFTLFLNAYAYAQTGETNAPVEMADALYQSGKIYVVVISLAVIFIGIIVYLFLLDKKISKLEKELKKN